MTTPENTPNAPAAADPPRRTLGPVARGLVPLGALLLVAAVYVFIARPFSPAAADGAALPPVFAQGVSLRDAVDASREQDRFVVAVASAAWCGPCGQYKRTTLRDGRVNDWISANAVAVYVDIDKSPDDAAMIGARRIPTTAIFYRGERIASVESVVPADRLVAWLDERWSARGSTADAP